jgi:drug/metabolite transporter (DMT)-like permease
MTDTMRGAIYGLAAAAIWGGMYVVSDVVLHIIPPFTLLTIRLMMGAIVLAPFVLRQATRPTRREIVQMMMVGFVGFGISVGAQFVGTDKSTAVNGTLVTSASPAFILLFAALILREKLTMQRIGAVLLATIGVVVIVDPAQADFGSQTFAGNVILAFAALTWGLYSVLVRKVSGRLDTLTITFFAFLGGLVLTIPAAALELPQRPIGEITPGVILGILYLGVVSTAVAMWMWNRSFALVDASLASLFFFAQPLVGTLLSVLLLNQQMTAPLWIGSILIGGGLLLSIVRFEQRIGSDSSPDTRNEMNNVTSNENLDKPSGEPGNLAV